MPTVNATLNRFIIGPPKSQGSEIDTQFTLARACAYQFRRRRLSADTLKRDA
jgi:hypothetical protein